MVFYRTRFVLPDGTTEERYDAGQQVAVRHVRRAAKARLASGEARSARIWRISCPIPAYAADAFLSALRTGTVRVDWDAEWPGGYRHFFWEREVDVTYRRPADRARFACNAILDDGGTPS